MGNLYLIRHGETTANVMKRLDTQLPGAGLTDFGVRQAIRYGLENIPTESSLLYSSQARRAQETAELIADAWNLKNVVLPDIYEVQVGELEMRNDKEAHQLFEKVIRDWHQGDLESRLPGGESLLEVQQRFSRTLETLLPKLEMQNIYVVSHGAAIRLIAAQLAGVSAEFAIDHHLSNTDSIALAPIGPKPSLAEGTWEIIRWGKYVTG